jgi:hypothetical protein
VVELLVSRYQERKQTVPWREIYYIVFHQHKFSDKEKSVELSLDEGHTVARASHFLNVTVNCKRRMWPSASQPFHYFQIKIIRKHDTHMSVGITDRDWVYTGNLVGFGQKCYNYAFHSNGLLLDAGRDISVPSVSVAKHSTLRCHSRVLYGRAGWGNQCVPLEQVMSWVCL